VDPLVRFALAHAEQASLDHLEAVGLQVREQEEQPVFGCRQGAVLVHAKCLYKINFIFFAKILDDLFHILDQMSKAGICPKFDPFIFHKTPQYLYQIQFGRILRKVENR
jgi:hypothetical protein